MRIRREKDFISCFDEKKGRYIRTGIIKDGKDIGIDPFMASFPELLDIGIMGHCKHGQKGLCLQAGIECYQDGLHKRNANMTLEDFESIAKQCKRQTYQFALGGRGDPDQHESFKEILEICQQTGITPNFTTSGLGLTGEISKLCSKYCGAVAVSWYRSEYTQNAINLLLKEGVKTNIHYVLSRNSIKEAVERLESCTFPEGINAIVFLLHKPVGLGRRESMITMENKDFQKLIHLVTLGKTKYKIGFDSCTVPALINNLNIVDIDSLDTCEGVRWSAYISSEMKMMPCSFDNEKMRWAVDLRSHTILEAWNSKEFENFREYFRTACPDCVNREQCKGGCPISPEIVLCKKKQYVKGDFAD